MEVQEKGKVSYNVCTRSRRGRAYTATLAHDGLSETRRGRTRRWLPETMECNAVAHDGRWTQTRWLKNEDAVVLAARAEELMRHG
ncbi:glycogen synthase [Sesbania bispinosa]|nr:glycogen synthase [Sesbania bispinosa]